MIPTDQASAEKYYGANAERMEYGYTYQANTNATIQLLQGGDYLKNKTRFTSQDFGAEKGFAEGYADGISPGISDGDVMAVFGLSKTVNMFEGGNVQLVLMHH